MSEIAMLAGMATIGAAATYTAWPFIAGKADEREYLEAGPEEEIEDRLVYLEEQVRSSLSRLKVEAEVGLVSGQALEAARKRHEKRLKLIQRHLDGLDAGRLPSEEAIADLEDEILGGEEVVEAMLEAEEMHLEAPRTGNKKARAPAPGVTGMGSRCIACGHTATEADAAFCGRCGAALACRSCGQSIMDPQAAFCGRCGGALRSGQE